MTTDDKATDRYLAALAAQPIPRTARGFLRRGPVAAGELAGQTVWQAGLNLPLAVLRVPELDHNIDRMRRWSGERGTRLAPHVKTTMAPWIMARQLAAGAWALTVANCNQAQVCMDMAAPAVLVANEISDPADIGWLAGHARAPARTRLLCYVDSLTGVSLLAGGLRAHGPGRPLDVLVEVGATDRRAGCRTVGQALAVARQAAAGPLRVRGVGGFEGVIGTGRSAGDLASIDAFCDLLHETGDALIAEGLAGSGEPVILTAAGSVYFDRVAARLGRPFRDGSHPLVVLRSGGYVSHDHGYLKELSPIAGTSDEFRPALQVWAAVLSVPQDDLAIVNAGRRDVGTDAGLPVVAGRRRRDAASGADIDGTDIGSTGIDRAGVGSAGTGSTGTGSAGTGSTGTGWQEPGDLRVTGIYDQHACVRRRGGGNLRGRLQVGDTVALGISHPCTTFDRWQYIVAVDEQEKISGVVRTLFG